MTQQEEPKQLSFQWRRAMREVANLREREPESSRTKLARSIIKDYCVRAASVGAATSAIGLIPAFGRMANWLISMVADTATTAKIQEELCLRIFALHDREPSESDLRKMHLWIATMGAGGSELVEQISNQLISRIAKSFAGKLLKRGLPMIEMTISSFTHVSGTYLVGHRAQLYCQLKGDDQAVAAFEKEHGIVTVNVRRITSWVKLGLNQVMETAEGTGSSMVRLLKRLTK
jgi:hypothetical protein